MNLLELSNIINSKAASVAFLQQRGVLHNPRNCGTCGNTMIYRIDTSRKIDTYSYLLSQLKWWGENGRRGGGGGKLGKYRVFFIRNMRLKIGQKIRNMARLKYIHTTVI